MAEVIFLSGMSTEQVKWYDLGKYTDVLVRRTANDGYSTKSGITDLHGLRLWLKANITDEVLIDDRSWCDYFVCFLSGEDAVMFKLSEWGEQLPEDYP